MLRAIAIAAVASAALVASAAFAANEAEPPEAHHFSFDGPLGAYDMGAVQRGFQVYCAGLLHLPFDGASLVSQFGRAGRPVRRIPRAQPSDR